ncbi:MULTISPECIES: D-amino acid aminotransferase [unclassified Campylobacter]|uniref:D-amino acid aminotransferase n=1 Tax=unclassified Campylobacter TaxID=2593542 RepID=UPI001238231D|nr:MULTISPECIES: D-amino acid aminotransferase [unclassified Campylobacter]KAA6228469.1 D-amino-acid transaminase [Campylobacter sp. LR185c]KAA6228955.1 D-amino-acid transaminase [Campylobacter sp. LR196d]KAA6229441.1 D-amino-acid transaminase [Campylobacter sp. LR286c]KAA6229907.1 D-amino-acid transaminase [Campylobacter sp. LR264d]KAA6234120.1 D-amino-acid transaminase [Campylobacter sp. LR291e]
MMSEKEIVFLNGEFLKKEEAKISVFDRGFIFGDGIYEVVPVVNGKMVDKEDFWERFFRSLKSIKLEFPYEKLEFEYILQNLIIKNNVKEGGIYLQVTRGVSSRDFAFAKNIKPTIMCFVFECEILNNPLKDKGISVVSVPDLRWKRRDIKSISLLGQCYAKEMAVEQKADEAFLVENGLVNEGSSSSAFMIKDKTLIVKPISNEILSGIRRKNILKFAKELNLNVNERAFSIGEVYKADEVFISAATILILPVISADKKLINNGKIGEFTKKLREKYVQNILEQVKN